MQSVSHNYIRERSLITTTVNGTEKEKTAMFHRYTFIHIDGRW